MGTRSLLGFHPKVDGKIHVQYQQFDGYPTVRGAEYFEFARKTLAESRHHFTIRTTPDMDDNEKPSKVFFDALKDYCNFAQWRTAHSMGNKFKCNSIAEFKALDAWQEWIYLFTADGDFHVYHDDADPVLVFPFAALLAVADHQFDDDYRSKQPIWEPIWKALEENTPVQIVISFGQRHAFPEQRSDGWRDWTIFTVKSKEFTVGSESQFATRGKARNTKKIAVESRVEKD